MKKCVILISLILFFPIYSLAFDDGDFQYWNTESVSWKIYEDWKIKLEEEFRFGDTSSDFYYHHSDLGITYSGLVKWLDIGFNYRLVLEESSQDWDYENRPHFNTTVKYDLFGLTLINRSRFEDRHVEDSGHSWRYRNKFTVKLPKMTQFDIQPYIADEIFVDFEAGELNRNRLYGGVTLKIIDNLKADIFYLWQTREKTDYWLDYNILGTKVNLSF